MYRKLIIVLVGLVLSLVASSLPTWAEPPSPVNEPNPPTATSRLGPGHRASVQRPAASSLAGPDCPAESRTTDCEFRLGQVDLSTNGTASGTIKLELTLAWRTKTNNINFTAHTHVDVVAAAGDTGGTTATLTASCASPCSASGTLAGPVDATGETLDGTFTFNDPSAQAHINNITFTLIPYKPDSVSIPGSGTSSTEIRCDDTLEYALPGCVNKAYTPTVSMGLLPEISALIARVQARGHYGEPGRGRPLHRLRNDAQRRKNRRDVCPRRILRPPGKSCDEYPFASTHEGGLHLPKGYRGIAMVPRWEQDVQGGTLGAFYATYRVIDNDAFWVEI
jgi:hypothetical protein